MPFQLKNSESLGLGTRRVCRERIGKARAQLRHSDRPAAVHGVRKEIKKLRAIFRLVRGEIGKDAYRNGTKALREAANRLAAPRDARVMLKAFAKLAGRRTKRFDSIGAALKQHLRRETRRFRKDDSAARAKRLLRKTGHRVDDLEIKATGWMLIEPELNESYRRGQVAYRLVRREPLPENFHDWRKHVKSLWYYLCLLYPAWSASSRRLCADLELLGEQLGEDHDLFLLQEFVTECGAEERRQVGALKRLISSRQAKLRAGALKLGAQLFDKLPAVFCRRLKNEWNTRRG